MKKIIYLKQEVKLGERIMYQGLEVEVTQALVDSNPEVFKVIDEMLPYKFTTEDGVNIYGNMKTWIVDEDLRLGNHSDYAGANHDYKYFYYKENALTYIEKHKEKTLEDYENIILQNTSMLMIAWQTVEKCDFYNVLKELDPKLYYTKILQLIADDLNDGRYIHIRRNASYHLSNAGEVNIHCGGDEGCVYFKSRELAFKARSILGDKVKYLFN